MCFDAYKSVDPVTLHFVTKGGIVIVSVCFSKS